MFVDQLGILTSLVYLNRKARNNSCDVRRMLLCSTTANNRSNDALESWRKKRNIEGVSHLIDNSRGCTFTSVVLYVSVSILRVLNRLFLWSSEGTLEKRNLKSLCSYRDWIRMVGDSSRHDKDWAHVRKRLSEEFALDYASSQSRRVQDDGKLSSMFRYYRHVDFRIFDQTFVGAIELSNFHNQMCSSRSCCRYWLNMITIRTQTLMFYFNCCLRA